MTTPSCFLRSWWWPCILFACSAVTDTRSTVDPGGAADGGAEPDSDLLRVEPAEADLFSTDTTAGTQRFRVLRRAADGREDDVTAEAELHLAESELGSVSGDLVTASTEHAGETELVAVVRGERSRARLRMHLSIVRLGDGVAADAPGRFADAAADAALAPELVYPADGCVLPPNLGDLDIHFTSTGELYELSVQGGLAALRLYTAGRPGEAGSGAWDAIGAADWHALSGAATDGQLVVGVRALRGARAGSAAPVTLRLTSQDMKGGIYYWSPPGGIYRHDFEQAGAAPELVYGAGESGGLGGNVTENCVGCHALSADGKRMAISTDVLQSGAATVIDVASGTQLFSPLATSFRFASFAPDGERLLTTFQGQLTVREAATGRELAAFDSGGEATHPDWSPAGDRVVFARIGAAAALTLGDAARAFGLPVPPFGDLPIGAGLEMGDVFFTGGSLWTSEVSGTSLAAPRALHAPPAGQNAYYPSFSPDARWVLFNQSAGDSYNDADARLFVLPADGSGEPLALAEADGSAADSANSWPRWAPFEQSTAAAGERVLWFTFSSVRAFGVRSAHGSRPQLWMAAFFPDRTGSAGRSAPAFRLPFQDLATGNHIAQWTREVVQID